jgi:hypothetical protein
MKSVALCWELGGGYGHLTRLRPVVRLFRERGFQVYLIARDLSSAERIVPHDEAMLLQAPFRQGASQQQFSVTPTFAHILHNVGYGDFEELEALVDAWRSLFETIGPDLIVADHSPTALLSARTLGLPSVVCGTGFPCPPDESPLTPMLTSPPAEARQFPAVEQCVRNQINRVLSKHGRPALERVTELYHSQTSRILLTFAELEHYPYRQGEKYWGCWPFQPGVPPDWPAGAGPRLFGYLQCYPQLPNLLEVLARLQWPTLLFVPGIDSGLRSRFESASLRFSDRMVDLRAIHGDHDIGITHANFGTVTALLLSGIPLLSIPRHLEQLLVANAVERLGAGVTALSHDIARCGQALAVLAGNPQLRSSARAFADRYSHFSPKRHFDEIADEFDKRLADFA